MLLKEKFEKYAGRMFFCTLRHTVELDGDVFIQTPCSRIPFGPSLRKGDLKPAETVYCGKWWAEPTLQLSLFFSRFIRLGLGSQHRHAIRQYFRILIHINDVTAVIVGFFLVTDLIL